MPTIDRQPKPYRVIYRPRENAIQHAKHFDSWAEAYHWIVQTGNRGRVETFKRGSWQEVQA